MDMAYQNALRKRDDLKRQLEEANEFLRLWGRVLGPGTGGGVTPPTDKNNGEVQTDSATGLMIPRMSASRERAAEMARKVILSKGMPMTRGELVDALEAERAPIGGANKSKNMGTIMWRLKDRFVNLDGLGYWPKDVPNERCRYNPVLGVSPKGETEPVGRARSVGSTP